MVIHQVTNVRIELQIFYQKPLTKYREGRENMKGKTIFISLVLGLILWIPAVQYACNHRAVFGIGSEILLPFMFVGGAYFILDVFETVKDWYWYYRKKK